jgi:hypoxanthine phosphoribosyltransferase
MVMVRWSSYVGYDVTGSMRRGQRGDPHQRQGVLIVDDVLDVGLHDSDVLDEIEMTSNLIIAASESEVRLPQQRIDEILGVEED